MKKSIMMLFILLTSRVTFGADVCQMNELSNGTQGNIEIICTKKSDSMVSDTLYNYSDGVNFRTERVKLMKVLLDKGYTLKAKGIFIKN